MAILKKFIGATVELPTDVLTRDSGKGPTERSQMLAAMAAAEPRS